MTFKQQRREDEFKQNKTSPTSIGTSRKKAGIQSDVVPANEETEGATGALEAPASPPEMTRGGQGRTEKRDES